MDNLKPCPLSEEEIDAMAVPYAGMGGVEDYRAFARDICTRLLSDVPTQAEPVKPAYPDFRPILARLRETAERLIEHGEGEQEYEEAEQAAFNALASDAHDAAIRYAAPPAPSSEAALVEALAGLHKVCSIALAGKDGKQHAYFETRAGHFVEATKAMQTAESALAKHGTQAATHEQLYRKVTVPISADGSVTEERFVRCNDCYGAVAEMFVSKQQHDKALTAYGEKVREAAAAVFEEMFRQGWNKQRIAEAIRSMPMPAMTDIEGEENGSR